MTANQINRIRRAGVSGAEFRHLLAIYEGCRRATDVAKALKAKLANASTTLKRLRKRGFLTQSDDPEDRRNKPIALTEKAISLVSEVSRGWSVLVQRDDGSTFFSHFPGPTPEDARRQAFAECPGEVLLTIRGQHQDWGAH